MADAERPVCHRCGYSEAVDVGEALLDRNRFCAVRILRAQPGDTRNAMSLAAQQLGVERAKVTCAERTITRLAVLAEIEIPPWE